MAVEDNSWRLMDLVGPFIGGLLMVIWSMLTGKIREQGKALDARINASHEEVQEQKQNISKLFDRLDQHGRESAARHIELLNALHEGLSKKEDK